MVCKSIPLKQTYNIDTAAEDEGEGWGQVKPV